MTKLVIDDNMVQKLLPLDGYYIKFYFRPDKKMEVYLFDGIKEKMKQLVGEKKKEKRTYPRSDPTARRLELKFTAMESTAPLTFTSLRLWTM